MLYIFSVFRTGLTSKSAKLQNVGHGILENFYSIFLFAVFLRLHSPQRRLEIFWSTRARQETRAHQKKHTHTQKAQRATREATNKKWCNDVNDGTELTQKCISGVSIMGFFFVALPLTLWSAHAHVCLRRCLRCCTLVSLWPLINKFLIHIYSRGLRLVFFMYHGMHFASGCVQCARLECEWMNEWDVIQPTADAPMLCWYCYLLWPRLHSRYICFMLIIFFLCSAFFLSLCLSLAAVRKRRVNTT